MISLKRIKEEILKEIIFRLENQERNIDISKIYGISTSTIELINNCKIYTNLHNYKNNIRNENKPLGGYRKNVLNEYIEYDNYYELRIINTHNIEVKGKIDKDDYEKVSKYKWTLSIHGKDIRIIGNSAELNRIGLHQFILNNNNNVNMVIDHINRNPLDNRKENLRIVSHSINSINAKARIESKTKIRGVYYRKERPGIAKAAWICEWSKDGKRHSKSFSIDKYGEDEAFRLACDFRSKMLREMKI